MYTEDLIEDIYLRNQDDLTRAEVHEVKARVLGRPVPSQRYTAEQLHRAGYSGDRPIPRAWAEFCLVELLLTH